MEINRVVVESFLACFLVALFCQLARFFYQSNQISYLAFLFLRLVVCGTVISAVYYLKRRNDIGELSQLVISGMVGLWIEN
ncbi:hypothetical protein NIES2119_31405 [[Phormidium ambiguum] IAM M-71]|uniref:Uncharacterized protein n=1 Tax=[Phormidium ambiguum] IAM M-71 TaxID=454136 RepID=A0A1U7I2D5_9CYAN|nr:hypothetical protein NIES2119_31405 [Phormidium ambiguum IAM M-71]